MSIHLNNNNSAIKPSYREIYLERSYTAYLFSQLLFSGVLFCVWTESKSKATKCKFSGTAQKQISAKREIASGTRTPMAPVQSRASFEIVYTAHNDNSSA